MRLDRHTTKDGRGKYALVKLRGLKLPLAHDAQGRAVIPPEVMDYGGSLGSEFFVIRLKDKFAGPALWAYAAAVWRAAGEDSITPQQAAELREYASDIEDLAKSSGNHPTPSLPS